MGEVDDYFDSLDDETRTAFERVRDLAMAAAPDAEQGVGYGMAALRYRGKPLLGFQAAKQHLAIYPFSPPAIDAVRERLVGFRLSKGTIRFTADTPLPDDVVRDLVRARLHEIDG